MPRRPLSTPFSKTFGEKSMGNHGELLYHASLVVLVNMLSNDGKESVDARLAFPTLSRSDYLGYEGHFL